MFKSLSKVRFRLQKPISEFLNSCGSRLFHLTFCSSSPKSNSSTTETTPPNTQMNTLTNLFLRVATWNVHSWQNASGVLQKVLEVKPDLIGFQELPYVKDPIDFQHEGMLVTRPFSSWTQTHSYDFKYLSVYTGFGNGMLSKWPFKNEISHIMITDSGYERRCFVGGIVGTPFGDMLVGTLHLDHIAEPIRMRQLKTLFDFFDENQYSSLPQIIVGDFNSLGEPTDYPEAEWQAIAYRRAQSKWERPHSDVYRTMIKSGYVDAWKAAGGNPAQASCWVGTRIDYIFTKNTEKILVPKKAFVGCSDSHVSDHNMMVVDFEYHPDLNINIQSDSNL